MSNYTIEQVELAKLLLTVNVECGFLYKDCEKYSFDEQLQGIKNMLLKQAERIINAGYTRANVPVKQLEPLDKEEVYDVLKRVVSYCKGMGKEYEAIQYTPIQTMTDAICERFGTLKESN